MHEEELDEGMEDEGGRDVAVVGMSGRFPGARDLDRFWENLRGGVDAVTFLDDEELLAAGASAEEIADPSYVKAAMPLDGVEEFDAGFFDLSPREAEILDPQQRLFLEHAWEALESAGHTPGRFDGLIGVYAGVAWNTYLLSNLTTHPELFAGAGGFQVFITNDKDFMPTRLSYKLDLKGPSVIVQTSCSTSLVATHLACLSLLSYECDLALVGGVTVKVPQKAGYYYQEGGLASPDGRCRAFDARAAGTIFGSGVGVVALRRLADAVADGDPIRAVIKGSAINNDGSVKVSYTAPSVEGQAEVIAAAQEMAAVDPATLGYVECHGTGTALGDPIEVRALTKVFCEATDERGFCALGSVKTNVGHLDAAAGVAGLIKTVLALEQGELPPSLHFERPNPALELDASPFYVNAELKPWRRTGPDAPRRAGVSSFGVGGTNAHVILEEAPAHPPSGPSRSHQLLVVSARSESAAGEAAARLRAFLEAAQPDDEATFLADVAYTLDLGRAVFRHRRALVCRDRAEAVEILAGGAGLLSAEDDEDPRPRPPVFLFSGQGSQYPGMGRGLYASEKVFREVVDRCSRELEPHLGCDLRQVMWPDGEDAAEAAARLERTRFTQPALFTIELATAELWRAWGIEPRALIGHSIGEIAAACFAGVMSLPDALGLVAARGALMDSLPPGAMLAVPLAEADLAELLGGHPEVSIAAVNEERRTVVAGPEEAIAAFEEALAAERRRGRRLHTSHAFHSPMMDPILERFAERVREVELRPPEIPLVSNLSGTWMTPEEATDPGYWARHLRQPVRFADGIATLLEEGSSVFIEVGPGRALATLARRHAGHQGQPVVTSLRHPQDEGEDLPHLLAALGRLRLAGLEVDPERFWEGQERRRLALPTYPFERQRYWIEPGERAAATAAAPGKRPDLGDWFYLPAWKPTLPPAAGEEPERAAWLVLAADDEARALAEALAAGGRRVVTVAPGGGFERLGETSFTVDPGRREDWDALLSEALADPDADAEVAVVHAWELSEAPAARSVEAFERAQAIGVAGLVGLLQALARARGEGGLRLDVTVLGRGLAAVAAGEPLHPARAALRGLCRVLPQELPGLRCRAIDLGAPEGGSDPAALAERLLAEIETAEGGETVALRGRRRFAEAFEPVRLPPAGDERDEDATPPALRREGLYLVTGGLTANGFAVARYLARAAGARLLLVEDPPLDPSFETDAEEEDAELALRRRRVAELEAAGGRIVAADADPADPRALERAIAAAEAEHGPLRGVIHAAQTVGERTFRTVLEIDDDHLRAHFRPKVHTLLALDEALGGERRLDFALLLSSLATVLGGLAYGAYAASNHVLDAWADGGCGRLPWRALDWDAWELDDPAGRISDLRADLAELEMTRREGERALARALAADADRLLVSTADLDRRIAERGERIAELRSARAPGGARTRHPRPELGAAYAPPESDLERRIAAVWQELLGFEEIGIDDNFFELGGDSFVAVQAASRLRRELGIELPVARLYEGLTVRTLAEILARDEAEASAERSQQLAERRESMERRKKLQERRRQRRRVPSP